MDPDAVHDLRVAIRRCRSFAIVMEEVDDHRTWQAMQRLPRKLFRALGALRDVHVLEAWVKELASPDDPVRARLLHVLEARQMPLRHQVGHAVRRFDPHAWERLARRASTRASLVSPNGLTAQCLALERYEDFRHLHALAVRTNTSAPWHALRVGLKRFRYAVECLLPGRSAEWAERLGQIQNLLGEIHDLDVLRAWITQESDSRDAKATGSLRQTIAARRRACIAQYRQRTCGDSHLLQGWRAELPCGTAIEAATAARLRTTARAMDRHPARTLIVSRLALQLFDGLARSGAEPRFCDDTLRRILAAAAELHAIRVRGRQTARHKAARDFLRAVPMPFGYKPSDWDLVAYVVRYHRGAEPARRHKKFAGLLPEQRQRILGLAGVLRFARGLHRCGVREVAGVGAESSAAYVRVRVSGMQDTEECAARLAAAKHLLERYLRRPLIVESARPMMPLRLVRRSPGLRISANLSAGSTPSAFDAGAVVTR
jgi:CHAD domain-containing protein